MRQHAALEDPCDGRPVSVIIRSAVDGIVARGATVAARAAARPAPIRRGRVSAGIGIAVVGHLPASGLWLVSFYTFIYHATPDSLFMVDRLVILFQLALFAGCVLAGGWLVLRGDRGVGLGLLIGWAVGAIALVVGTILISYSVPPDTAAAGTNTVYSHSLVVPFTP